MMMMQPTNNERPPLFRSWRAWYVLVIAVLGVLIVAFSCFTKYFA